MQGLDDWYETEAPSDVVVLDVVVEDEDGNAADVSDAERWRDAYGLSFTVLADAQGDWVDTWGNASSSYFNQHSNTIIDSTGRVAWHEEGWNPRRVDEIAEALEAVP